MSLSCSGASGISAAKTCILRIVQDLREAEVSSSKSQLIHKLTSQSRSAHAIRRRMHISRSGHVPFLTLPLVFPAHQIAACKPSRSGASEGSLIC